LSGSSGSYNAITDVRSSNYVVAYYQQIIKFGFGGVMNGYGKTTANTYPVDMQYVSSYDSVPCLFILNSQTSTGTQLYINIVKYSDLSTVNSIVVT